MYILDTDVLSELSRQSAHGALKTWISLQPANSLMISFSTYLEIYRGVERLRKTNPDKSDSLEQWFVRLIQDERFVTIDMVTDAAKLYARMTLTPELRFLWVASPGTKEPKCGQDLAIASLAIIHNVPIVTRNAKDFLTIHRFFPLPGVYDPAYQVWHLNVETSTQVNLPQLAK